MTPVIEFEDVTKSFDDKAVLDGVSFTVDAGSVLCLAGGNGSGKSTCVRLAAGHVRPDSGSVRVRERDVRPCIAAKAVAALEPRFPRAID